MIIRGWENSNRGSMAKIYTPTFQQMRLLEAVTRLGSVTGAAGELNLSQPSVSMQLKSLEEKIAAPLFEKQGKSLRLTPSGRVVHEASLDILARVEQMRFDLEDLQTTIAGELSIAVVSSAKYFLPQLVGAFKKRFPKVEPRLTIANREQLLERITQRLDDIYIIGQPPEGEALVYEPFMENIIVFIAPFDHPLSRQAAIPLSRLSQEYIIGRELGSGTRKAVEAIFQAEALTLTTHMEFDDSEAIKQAVISGLGLAYLSLHAVRLEEAAQELTILNVQNFPLHRNWYAVHSSTRPLSKVASSFLHFVREASFEKPL